MNFDCRTLFIGDLPNYCSEADLSSLFSAFGPVVEVQVHNGAQSGRSSSYAFVTLVDFAAIEAARKHLDGCQFMGRKLRVRRAKIMHSKTADNGQLSVVNSVYVRFVTSIIDRSITEFDLHRIFSAYGLVEDVIVKDSSINEPTRQQYGYAFVHFTPGKEGIQAAFQCVAALDRDTVDGLTLHVEVSRNLLKQFTQQQQQQLMVPQQRRAPQQQQSQPQQQPYSYHNPQHSQMHPQLLSLEQPQTDPRVMSFGNRGLGPPSLRDEVDLPSGFSGNEPSSRSALLFKAPVDCSPREAPHTRSTISPPFPSASQYHSGLQSSAHSLTTSTNNTNGNASSTNALYSRHDTPSSSSLAPGSSLSNRMDALSLSGGEPRGVPMHMSSLDGSSPFLAQEPPSMDIRYGMASSMPRGMLEMPNAGANQGSSSFALYPLNRTGYSLPPPPPSPPQSSQAFAPSMNARQSNRNLYLGASDYPQQPPAPLPQDNRMYGYFASSRAASKPAPRHPYPAHNPTAASSAMVVFSTPLSLAAGPASSLPSTLSTTSSLSSASNATLTTNSTASSMSAFLSTSPSLTLSKHSADSSRGYEEEPSASNQSFPFQFPSTRNVAADQAEDRQGNSFVSSYVITAPPGLSSEPPGLTTSRGDQPSPYSSPSNIVRDA